jgi:hypothetical protein
LFVLNEKIRVLMKENSTKKRYRSFNSVNDLLKAQDNVREEYKDLEDNAISSIFDPMNLALNIVPSTLRFFRFKKKNQSTTPPRNRRYNELKYAINDLGDIDLDKHPIAKKKKLNILHPSKNDSFGKKVFASFVRWQVLELAIWGTGKLIKKIRK